MTREELLDQLHNIAVRVSLVALPSEGALECTCVTPRGSCCEWFDLYNWTWPAYSIMLPPQEKWNEIRLKLKAETLLMPDIEGTELGDFYMEAVAEDKQSETHLRAFFSGLSDVSASGGGEVFALVWEKTVQFFLSEETLEEAFTEQWGVTPWEEYATDELETMLHRINEEFEPLPLTSFQEDS